MERCKMEVNYENIVHNYREVTKRAGGRIIPVVKDNACKAGAINTMKALMNYDKNIDLCAVATLKEAQELSKNFEDLNVWILGVIHPDSIKQITNTNIITTISSVQQLSLYLEKIQNGKYIKIALGFNTGMNRLGIKSNKDLVKIVDMIKDHQDKLELVLTFSHFAKGEDKDSYQMQANRAKEMYNFVEHVFNDVPFTMSSSMPVYQNGLLPFESFGKVGEILYNGDNDMPDIDLRDAFSVKSYITHIQRIREGEGVGYNFDFVADKDTNIAVIPLGYADGIPKFYKGNVLIKDKLYPVVGRVCMDQLMINLGDDSYRLFEEVEVISDNYPMKDIHKDSGIAPGEFVTRMNKRVVETFNFNENQANS